MVTRCDWASGQYAVTLPEGQTPVLKLTVVPRLYIGDADADTVGEPCAEAVGLLVALVLLPVTTVTFARGAGPYTSVPLTRVYGRTSVPPGVVPIAISTMVPAD